MGDKSKFGKKLLKIKRKFFWKYNETWKIYCIFNSRHNLFIVKSGMEFRSWIVLWVTQINNWINWCQKVRSPLSTSDAPYYLIEHEHIQHTTKGLWEHKDKTRSDITGSLASSCSNVFLRKHGFRASTADTDKRGISNRIYRLLLGNSSQDGIEIEKVGQYFLFLDYFSIFSQLLFSHEINQSRTPLVYDIRELFRWLIDV